MLRLLIDEEVQGDIVGGFRGYCRKANYQRTYVSYPYQWWI